MQKRVPYPKKEKMSVMKRNFQLTLPQAMQGVQRAYQATQLARKAFKTWKEYTRSKRPRIAAGVATTSQRDYKQQYRFKRMPRRKRRRWVKALRRNTAMDLTHYGTRTVIRNATVSSAIPFNSQGFCKIHLYGRNGAVDGTEVGNTDINDIIDTDDTFNPAKSWKCYFTAAIIDMTIRNTGTVPIEMDVYEITYNGPTKQNKFQAMLEAAENATEEVKSAQPKIQLGTRGATLFDLPELIRYGRIKIWKKTKIFLPEGDTATYQSRDPRNHVFTSDLFIDETGFVIPKVTKSYILVAKTVVGSGETTGGFSVGVTRTYRYKVLEKKDNASALV